MEVLVPSYVIIKDILVSADHFIPFNSHKILNKEEFLNQEINMQYKLHIKALQVILVILAGIPLLRLDISGSCCLQTSPGVSQR